MFTDQFILKEYYSYYGKDCAYWIDVFYNSENGELIFKKEYDNCDKLQKNQKTEIEKLNLGQLNLTLMNRTNEYFEVTTPIFQYNWEF